MQVRAFLIGMAEKWIELAELSENDGWNAGLRARALQAAIGRDLKAHYEVPQQLPHRLFTLLMQINAQLDSGHPTGDGG